MKKVFIGVICVVLLSSCFQKEQNEIVEEKVIQKEQNEVVEKTVKTLEDLTEEEITKSRGEISLDDLDLLLVGTESDIDTDNLFIKQGKEFLDAINKQQTHKITQRVDGGIEYGVFEEEIGKIQKKKKIELDLEIVDFETKKPISKGIVYVNNIKMGEFENGVFRKEFEWPLGIERFSVMVRAEGYGDAFKLLNSIRTDGSLLMGKFTVKKLTVSQQVDLSEDLDYKGDKFQISFPKCSLVDSSGQCFTGQAKMNVNFVSSNQANQGQLSIPMKAITREGEVISLTSGGMAFVDFITEDKEILQLGNEKKVSMTYQVSDSEIEGMKNVLLNGYWWFDKTSGYWFQGERDFAIDKEKKTWSIITSYLY